MDLFLASDSKACDDFAIKELGFPSIILMENAARSIFEEIKLRFIDFSLLKFVILYGTGNNGGDALALARILIIEGAIVKLVEAVSAPKTPDAILEMQLLMASSSFYNGVEFLKRNEVDEHIDNNTIIIDGVFGTGLKEGLSTSLIELFEKTKKAGFVISIDLPSGVNPDNGSVLEGAISSDLTITFMLPKIGLYVSPGASYCGEVVVKQLMIPCKKQKSEVFYVTEDYVQELLHEYSRKKDSHKGNYGHVGIISPEEGMEGAVSLCADALLKSGVGKVSIIGVNEESNLLRSRMSMLCPEAMMFSINIDTNTNQQLKKDLEKFNCLVIGPGYGKKRKLFLRKIIENIDIPMVIDADALNLISEERELIDLIKNKNVILTPHPGEMSRLSMTDNVQQNRLSILKSFTQNFNFSLLLKGYRSMLYSGDSGIYINSSGNPALSKGGSGDVLSGMIAAFIAQGMKIWQAGIVGMFIHGLCADRLVELESDLSINPTDIINEIGNVLLCLKK